MEQHKFTKRPNLGKDFWGCCISTIKLRQEVDALAEQKVKEAHSMLRSGAITKEAVQARIQAIQEGAKTRKAELTAAENAARQQNDGNQPL